MQRIFVFLIAVHACAAITNVRVLGTTATQAVIAYRAPNESACAVRVSERNDFSGGYAPVHDVDSKLFAGSDQDSRPEAVVDRRERFFVVGKRTSERATDRNLYSRALQANTIHYFQIACGSDIATGSFRTSNIPLGMLYPDIPPSDPDNPGEYAWPNFSPRLRTSYPGYVSDEAVVDPHTGLLARRWTLQEDVADGESVSSYTVAADRGGRAEWSHPQSALADDGDAEANAAVYSGTERSYLFLGYTSYDAGPRAFRNWGIAQGGTDYYRVLLKGWGSAAAVEDRTVEVCLTLNRVDCASVVKEIALSNAAGTYDVSDSNGAWMSDWRIQGRPAITRSDMASPSGTVDVTGAIVTRTDSAANYGWFSKNWTAGSVITINGVDRTIKRIISAGKLEIMEDLGTIKGASFTASNFGVLIRKKTASPDKVAVAFAQARTRITSGAYYWSASATSEDCSRLKDSDGRYYCNISGKLYSVDPASGDARLLGSTRMPQNALPGLRWGIGYNGGTWNGDCGSTTYVDLVWSPSNPREWYCLVPVGNASTLHLVKGRYTGTGGGLPSQQLNTDTWTTPESVAYTDLSIDKDLSTMIREFSIAHGSPEVFDPSLHSCNLASGQFGNYLPFWCLRGGGQDKLGWIAVYDTSKNDVIAAMTTHANPWPARWGAGHGAGMFNSTAWMAGAGQATGRLDAGTLTGAGPYVATVPAGVPSCQIGSTCDVCPANLSGNPHLPNWPEGMRKCSRIVVDGEPCDIDPNPLTETNTNHPHCGTAGGHFLQDAKPGDIFVLNNKYGEFVRLLAKSGDGKGQTWTVERKYGTGWRGLTSCGANCKLLATAGAAMVNESNSADNYAGSFYWDFLNDPAGLNANGETVITDENGINAHNATNNGYRVVVNETGATSEYRVSKGADVRTLLNPPFQWLTGNPGFANPRIVYPSATESHAGMNQVSAAAYEKQWTVDARPWLGSAAYGNGATLVSGMSSTYRIAQPPLSRKHLPTLAFCGYHPLTDRSGPKSTISDANPYTYCVANAAGECVAGSAQGDAFVSCPMVVNTACGTDNQPEKEDICLGDLRPFTGEQVQLGLERADPRGEMQRLLTRSFTQFKLQGPYWNLKALPDASWFYTRNDWLEGASNNLLLFKNPGWPAKDSVNRGTFVPVRVQIGSVPAGTGNVVVEFGYDPQFQCTSRPESCIARGAAIDEAVPFYWASEAYTGTPCGNGCSVSIPSVPQRVVYYRVKYRDGSNAVIRSSMTQVAVVP